MFATLCPFHLKVHMPEYIGHDLLPKINRGNLVACLSHPNLVLTHMSRQLIVLLRVQTREIPGELEWRVSDSGGTYTRYYAGNQSDSEDAETMENIETFVTAFTAFYQNKGLPNLLRWRKYDI